MQEYYFSLRIPYAKCERFYLAGVNSAILISECGKRIQLPTKNLRFYIDRNGINGRFRLIIDEHNKVKSFEKMC